MSGGKYNVLVTSPGKGEVGAERRVGVNRFDRTPAKTLQEANS